MAVHPQVDSYLKNRFGASGYSTSGDNFTIGSVSFNHARLQELLDVAQVTKHDVKVVAGAIQVVPR